MPKEAMPKEAGKFVTTIDNGAAVAVVSFDDVLGGTSLFLLRSILSRMSLASISCRMNRFGLGEILKSCSTPSATVCF